MLGCVRKRKRMDKFEYRVLRDVVKEGGEDVIERFEKKFKEIKVEGNRESVAGVIYTDLKLPETYETKYTESELEALYMGTESEARKKIPKTRAF